MDYLLGLDLGTTAVKAVLAPREAASSGDLALTFESRTVYVHTQPMHDLVGACGFEIKGTDLDVALSSVGLLV